MQIENRQARFNFEFLETVEAGIKLIGSEVKSLREGKGNIVDAHIVIENDEAYILNMYIARFNEASYNNHEELRKRKLLLNKREIISLKRSLMGTGTTIIPISCYLNKKGLFKLNIALAKGRKTYDKRQYLKEKDIKRQMSRDL